MRTDHRTLSSERGHRAVILFYEDRPHLEDNATIKTELSRFIIDNQLTDRLVVYGVANLGDVGSVPHALVRQMIQPAVDRWDVDILLDWDGMMRRPPFSFATAAANVAVIDREGRMIYSFTGTIDADQRRSFYRAIRQVIAH